MKQKCVPVQAQVFNTSVDVCEQDKNIAENEINKAKSFQSTF